MRCDVFFWCYFVYFYSVGSRCRRSVFVIMFFEKLVDMGVELDVFERFGGYVFGIRDSFVVGGGGVVVGEGLGYGLFGGWVEEL